MSEKYVHITKDGTEIELCDLSNSHLENIIRLIERKAEEGVPVCCGGIDGGIEPWYDEDEEALYGDDVKILLRYSDYIKEELIRLSKEQENK